MTENTQLPLDARLIDVLSMLCFAMIGMATPMFAIDFDLSLPIALGAVIIAFGIAREHGGLTSCKTIKRLAFGSVAYAFGLGAMIWS